MDYVNLILSLLFLVMIAAVGLLIKHIRSYNIKVRVRFLSGGATKQITDDRGKVYIGSKNEKLLSLFSLKKKVPIYPDDAVDLTNKGKVCVEAYADKQGNWSWIIDKGIKKFWHSTNTNQQVLLANQIHKSETKGKLWQQMLPMYVAVGGVISLIAVFLIFAGEPLKALSTYTEKVTAPVVTIVSSLDHMTDVMQEMTQGIQRLEAQAGTAVNSSNAPN